MATDLGAGPDLRAYLGENGPLPPHRAALLVAELAEQLAAAHAGGRAYGCIDLGTVHVENEGTHGRVSVSAPATPDEPPGAVASADVHAAGLLLAALLGSAPGAGPALQPPDGVPDVLRRVVESCTEAAPSERPAAASLARQLRDAARDLLLGVAPAVDVGPAGAAGTPAPRYLPDHDLLPGPAPSRRRSRQGGTRLLVGGTTAVAIALAGAGILLPAAGVRLPSLNGGLARAAHQAIGSPSPARATATETPAASAGSGPSGLAATAPPDGPQPGSEAGGPVTGPAALGPPAATRPPPAPGPPPPGEPAPAPGTTFPVTAYEVPNGSIRPPLVRGRLTWYNRSVGLAGVISSTGPCAAAVYTGYAGGRQVARYQTAYRCGAVDVSQTLDGHLLPGGITEVIVDLYVSGRLVGRDSCLRQTHACNPA